MLFNLFSRYGKKSHNEVKIATTLDSSADDRALAKLLPTYDSDFTKDIAEYSAPASYNVGLAYHDAKSSVTSIASAVFNIFKTVYYAAATAVQFVYSGFSGVYENPKYASSAAESFAKVVDDAAHAVDSAADTLVDLGTAAVKGLVALAPSVIKAADTVAMTVGGLVASGLDYALSSTDQEEDTNSVDEEFFDALETQQADAADIDEALADVSPMGAFAFDNEDAF